MAQQIIGIGTTPNDGTGDTIRDAFDKCNDNDTELYSVVDTFIENNYGILEVGTTGSHWNNYYFIYGIPSTKNGYVTSIRIAVEAAQTGQFAVYEIDHDANTATRIALSQIFSLAAGVNNIDVNMPISAGQYVGWHVQTGISYGSGTVDIYYNGSEIVEDRSVNHVLNNPQFGFEITPDNKNALILLDSVAPQIRTQKIGLNGVADTGSNWTNIYTILPTPAENDGFVTSLTIAVEANQTVVPFVTQRNGDGTHTKVYQHATISLTAGVNNIDVNMPISAGQYVGYRCSTGVRYTSGGSPVWYSNTDIGENSNVLTSSNINVQVEYTLSGYILGGVINSQSRLSTVEDYLFGATLFNGKKWAALGTSITSQAKYTNPLVTLLDGIILTNLGVVGASLGDGSGSGGLGIYNQIANIPSDTDIVTLEAGTNDFGAGVVDLGAIGDTTTDTFYGALYAACAAIHAVAPSARILMFTPFSGSSSMPSNNMTTVRGDGARLYQFQQAIEDMAKMTGWPCVDVGRRCGLNYYTASNFTSDGLHPNTAGGLLMAQYIAQDLYRLGNQGFFG